MATTETKKLAQAYLNGKPLWKCSHSELTTYCKKNNIELKPGLKTYQVGALVKKHLEQTGGGAKAVDKISADISAKITNLKPATKATKAVKGMESIKIWNLHKEKGLTPEQIEKELGHAAWYNKKTIDRYSASESLQARAKEVFNATKK